MRSIKLVDCHLVPKALKCVRDYSSNLDKLKVKKSVLGSIVTYQLYNKVINEENLLMICLTLSMASLNDNDLHYIKKTKSKKIQQLSDVTVGYDISDYSL